MPLFFLNAVDPFVKVELVSDEVSELEPFSLTCLTLNLPTPQVSWLKDSTLLKTEELIRISVNTSIVTEYQAVSTLTVDRAEPGIDDGIYQCRIDNTQGSGVVFDYVNIIVQGEPPLLSFRLYFYLGWSGPYQELSTLFRV